MNVENITIECGGHNEFNEQNEEQVFDAICRIMQEMNMIDEKRENFHDKIFVFEKRKKLYANCSGLFKSGKNLGDKVKQGEVIGKIYNSSDLADVRNVVAECDGVINNFVYGHIVWEGDVLCELVPAEDIKLLQ